MAGVACTRLAFASPTPAGASRPMRYRRLLEYLRQQSRIAVGIDLVIVVLGVFIGIQVANWKDSP